MSRQKRKIDHVRLATEGLWDRCNGFSDVHLVHNCLPEVAFQEISLETELCGHKLSFPVLINAMTGGASPLKEINRSLARLAREFDLAIAVGSQRAALEDPSLEHTFRIVREEHPNGIVLANLGADASISDAHRAVEMIRANLLQIHLNPAQELIMAEGDRDFRGLLENIARLAGKSPVPVIVKEVGFGIALEEVSRLVQAGVRAIDIGGRGGTNFAGIEFGRKGEDGDPGLLGWGLSTAVSLVEAASTAPEGIEIVATGGIVRGSEAAKALALGAKAVGVAGGVLRELISGGLERARGFLSGLVEELRIAMVLTGARRPSDLMRRPVVITGETGEWLRLRGVDISGYARRGGK